MHAIRSKQTKKPKNLFLVNLITRGEKDRMYFCIELSENYFVCLFV